MEDLHFVYSLSHQGHIFYIGYTKDLEQRFRFHIGSASKKVHLRTPVANYIKGIRDSGGFPEMTCLFCVPKQVAHRIETTLIIAFSRAGYKLYNFQFNWEKWWGHTKECDTKKAAYKRLSDIQKKQIDWYKTYVIPRNPIYSHWIDNIL